MPPEKFCFEINCCAHFKLAQCQCLGVNAVNVLLDLMNLSSNIKQTLRRGILPFTTLSHFNSF